MKDYIKYLLLSSVLVGCTTIGRTDYISVDQMSCPKVEETFSKRQLSELSEEEKFLVKNSSTCGIAYPDVRIKRSNIVGYAPFYSIDVNRTDKKYEDDPDGPLHVTKINIESCNIALIGNRSDPIWVVINKTCDQFDKILSK